ncbi:MAG TPA: nickel-dependent hydrogenase large subunit [Gammaproteobacteria bacterium]
MNDATSVLDLVSRGRPAASHRPWPRYVVDEGTWVALGGQLAAGRASLVGLWGEHGAVHAALSADGTFFVASLECPRGAFPSLARVHAPALRLERAIRDLYGLEPEGLPDPRPWLVHARGSTYPFLPVEGESLHQVPVGPVHAGIIEPGHFRFTVNGETVVRLEARLGYVHKGIESLMAGADVEHAARLAGRTSGDSTVAYAIAFARAVEAAVGADVPARAHWLRALMGELERLANHVGDIGAVCNDAAFALMHAHCAMLRERVLRAADECFGHRLMRDQVVPGGVAADLDAAKARVILGLVDYIAARFPALIDLYESTASLQDRTVGAGTLTPSLAEQFAAGGYVGRASGRDFDARRQPGYPPYDALDFDVPVLREGDVNARVWIRIREVEQSLKLVRHLIERMPEGATRTDLAGALAAGAARAPSDPPRAPHGTSNDAGPDGGPARREGVALVEGFRGDVLVWVALDADGTVARCHLRDPSWFQWPLLEAAIEGNIVADFPLCNKSFNCAYSGHDL